MHFLKRFLLIWRNEVGLGRKLIRFLNKLGLCNHVVIEFFLVNDFSLVNAA